MTSQERRLLRAVRDGGRVIESKFDGRCTGCKHDVREGDQILWQWAPKRVSMCPSCMPGVLALGPTPGPRRELPDQEYGSWGDESWLDYLDPLFD